MCGKNQRITVEPWLSSRQSYQQFSQPGIARTPFCHNLVNNYGTGPRVLIILAHGMASMSTTCIERWVITLDQKLKIIEELKNGKLQRLWPSYTVLSSLQQVTFGVIVKELKLCICKLLPFRGKEVLYCQIAKFKNLDHMVCATELKRCSCVRANINGIMLYSSSTPFILKAVTIHS